MTAITKILDGSRSAVFHISLSGNADLNDEVLIDPAVDFGMEPGPSLTVEQIWYDLIGFDARLEFDYLLSDTPIWTMSGGQYAHVDFCHFGGLKDRSDMDGRGKIKITTSGLAIGDYGTIIIKVRKD